jgi:hypothetical protein
MTTKLQGWFQVYYLPYGMNYHVLFTILITISTTTTRTTHPQDGLGYASEPSTLASALYLVKRRNKGAKLPSIKDNHKDKGHFGGHTATEIQDHLLSPLRQTLALLGSLLEAKKRRSPGLLGRGRRTLHRFCPPRPILALALIILRDLGSTPSIG